MVEVIMYSSVVLFAGLSIYHWLKIIKHLFERTFLLDIKAVSTLLLVVWGLSPLYAYCIYKKWWSASIVAGFVIASILRDVRNKYCLPHGTIARKT